MGYCLVVFSITFLSNHSIFRTLHLAQVPGELFKEYVALPPNVLTIEASAVNSVSNVIAGVPASHLVCPVEPGVVREYLVPEPLLQCRYAEWVEPLRAKLLYFFIQAPAPDAPAGTILRISPTLQESLQRVREVTYDRGTVVDELAREALRMSSASERLRTFEDCCSTKFARAIPTAI